MWRLVAVLRGIESDGGIRGSRIDRAYIFKTESILRTWVVGFVTQPAHGLEARRSRGRLPVVSENSKNDLIGINSRWGIS